MFEISVECTFAAGHALREYKGKCENVHGHNYKVQVTVAGKQLNSAGLLIDFSDLRAEVKRLVEGLDHCFLNDVPPFDRLNPTAENLAKYLADSIAPFVGNHGLTLCGVTVWETDTTAATYRPS